MLASLLVWDFRHREAVSWPIINKFFGDLYDENATRKVFAAGYGWGGRYACLLTHRKRWTLSGGRYREGGLVESVFVAHPSELKPQPPTQITDNRSTTPLYSLFTYLPHGMR